MFILVIASAKHFQQICSVMFVAGFKLLANDHCITPIQKSRFVLTTGSKNKKLPKWHVYPIRMGQLNEQFIKHPASFPIVFPWVFPMVFFRKNPRNPHETHAKVGIRVAELAPLETETPPCRIIPPEVGSTPSGHLFWCNTKWPLFDGL